MRNRDHGVTADSLWMFEHEAPTNTAANVLSRHVSAVQAEGVEQIDNVPDTAIEPVRFRARGLVGAVVTPLIRDDHSIASACEHGHWTAPCIPELWKAV